MKEKVEINVHKQIRKRETEQKREKNESNREREREVLEREGGGVAALNFWRNPKKSNFFCKKIIFMSYKGNKLVSQQLVVAVVMIVVVVVIVALKYENFYVFFRWIMA